MAPDRSSITSVLMVLMVVLSSLIAPVGGAAAADAGECSNLDDFVMFLSLGAVNSDTCSRQAYVDAAITDMQNSDANQTKLDIYTAAAQQASGEETFKAPMQNYIQDTDSIAWIKAESAVAQSYENGSSDATAKTEAKESIADYYTEKQINLIEQWNATVAAHETMRQQAEMEDGINPNFVTVSLENDIHDTHDIRYGTATVTLPDDTQHTVRTVKHVGEIGGLTGEVVVHPGMDPESSVFNPASGRSSNISHLKVKAPNSNYDPLLYADTHEYRDMFLQIQNQNDNLQSETDVFVEGTWSEFDSGQINATDVLSTNTAMSEYGTRSADESEGLWRSTAALSMMGYDTPDLNNSGMMTVEYKGVEHTGLLMAKNAPGGAWEVNTTYHVSNISGPVFMTTTGGKKIDFQDGEMFTIVGMTAKDGSAINSTQTTKYRYKTANTSELLEVQNQLMDLRQEIEDREPDAGASFDLGASDTQLVGLLALAGVLLLAQNRGRGGRY